MWWAGQHERYQYRAFFMDGNAYVHSSTITQDISSIYIQVVDFSRKWSELDRSKHLPSGSFPEVQSRVSASTFWGLGGWENWRIKQPEWFQLILLQVLVLVKRSSPVQSLIAGYPSTSWPTWCSSRGSFDTKPSMHWKIADARWCSLWWSNETISQAKSEEEAHGSACLGV